MRSACYRRTNDITDAIDKCLAFSCQFYSCQCISRFSRLGNGDHYIFLADDGVAVPEFGCVLYFYWYTCQVFYQVFAYQGAVPGCAAGSYNKAFCVVYPVDVFTQPTELYPAL